MRRLFFLILLPILNAQAAQPSNEAIFSCLMDYSVSSGVILKPLATNEIYEQENYKSAYKASYYFKAGGKDIGYAEKKGQYGIIYAGDIYPIDSAKRLLKTRLSPSQFNPFVADWSKVRDANGIYICVSFNVYGIGPGIGFQKNRAGYLLSASALKRSRILFFISADTALFKGN